VEADRFPRNVNSLVGNNTDCNSRLASPASAWGAVHGRKSPLPSFECVA
jgi:hypothetical protein